jgi:hypothetical protein
LILLFAMLSLARAEQAVTTAEAPSTRFEDAAVAGPTFELGAQVEVLVRKGKLVRVHDGDRYGWVDAKLITAIQAPPPAPPP